MGDLGVILRLAQDNSPTELPWQHTFGIFRQSFLRRMTLDSSCSSCLHLLSAARGPNTTTPNICIFLNILGMGAWGQEKTEEVCESKQVT